MIRLTIFICFVLSLWAAQTQAEEHPPFAVTSEATRTGETISVLLRIVENKMEVVPNIGKTNVTTVRSSPRIKFMRGKQAEISIGRYRSADGGKNPATEPAGMESGIRVEAISIKDQDNVLIVTSVIEDGSVIWADAATIKVQTKPVGQEK